MPDIGGRGRGRGSGEGSPPAGFRGTAPVGGLRASSPRSCYIASLYIQGLKYRYLGHKVC